MYPVAPVEMVAIMVLPEALHLTEEAEAREDRVVRLHEEPVEREAVVQTETVAEVTRMEEPAARAELNHLPVRLEVVHLAVQVAETVEVEVEARAEPAANPSSLKTQTSNMKTIRIAIRGDKIALIKALTALQNAKIDVVGVKVGTKAEKPKRAGHKAHKLAEAYHDNY